MAKRIGSSIRVRSDWTVKKRLAMMEIGLCNKFFNKELAKRLVETYPSQLVEGNTWHDNFWGNCTCSKCVDIVGENHLGRLLTVIRDRLMGGKNV